MDPVDLDWAHSDPGSHAKVNATASGSRKSSAGAVNAETQTGGGNVPGSAVAARQNVNEHTCRIIHMACELRSKHEGQKLRIGVEEGTRVRFEYGCALRMKSKISGYSNPGRNVARYSRGRSWLLQGKWEKWVGWIRSSHAAQTFVRPFDRRIQIQKSNFSLRYFDLLIAFFAATLPFVLGKKLPRAHHNFWTRSRLFLYGAVFILESSQRC